MRLKPGDEFRDPAPAARGSACDRCLYRVTGVVREAPWWGLYRGKKVFTSYHFGRRALEQTSEQESLDVFLKALQYPTPNDRESIKDLREQLFFECRRVLGRTRQSRGPQDGAGSEKVVGRPLSNLLPEPLDYLQVPNDRDVFEVPNPRQLIQYEPILVMEAVNGVPLDRWRAGQPSTPRVLRVLADLLDFLASVHAEGMLLNGLCPEVVWVGEDDRLHYLGSDRIIDAGKQQKQRRLYPPERYPAGFSPAELLAPGEPISPGTDLYGWAALAYFLLTGEGPEAITSFEDEHFARLEQVLQAVSGADLKEVGYLFRAGGPRFVHTWPDSLLGVLRECLRPQVAQRPAGREDLARLGSTARPRGVPAALAVHTGRMVEVLLAVRDLEPGLEMVVRRAADSLPQTPVEGQPVTRGPLVARAVDRKPGATEAYAVFTGITTGGEPIWSRPTAAPLLDLARPDRVLAFAELAAQEESSGDIPPRVLLLEELADATPAARALFDSSQPEVRRWAIRLLEGPLRHRKAREAARDLLLSRALGDSDAEVRQMALRALLQGERPPEVDLVVRVAQALGDGSVEAALAALARLPGLPPGAAGEATRRLEGERPVSCPVCGSDVRAAGLDEHLVRQHGHVSIGGPPLPYADALRTLWQRLVALRDEEAAVRLAGLFAERTGDRAVTAYRNAFEAQLQIHASALGPAGSEAEPAPAWRQLGACLAAHELSLLVCRELLAHAEPRLRMLARLALVPGVARRLAGKADAAAFRTSLDGLCPLEDAQTRQIVCRHLAGAGASKKAAREVAAELEQDRTAPCPHCNQPVRQRDERDHLRREHGIYELDGARLGWDEMLERLAARLLSDRQAPRLYVEVAGDRLNEAGVVRGLMAVLARLVPPSGGVPSLTAVAELPQASGAALQLLVGGHHRAGLALAAALGPGASLTLLERVAPLAGEPALSLEDRRQAVGLVLSSRNAEPGTAERAVDRYLGGQADPLLMSNLLDALEQVVGAHPIIEKRRRTVRATASARCPACQAVFDLAQMEEHVWQTHRLIVERGAWRPAWEVIAGWLDEYGRDGDDRHVQRALALANRDDDRKGAERLAQLARQKGLRSPLLAGPAWSGEGLRVAMWVVGMLLALGLVLWLLFR